MPGAWTYGQQHPGLPTYGHQAVEPPMTLTSDQIALRNNYLADV